MTNGKKYKTAEERFDEFRKFCKDRQCEHCPCKGEIHGSDYKCMLEWLDLEYKEELKPCPFCGSKDIDYFETDFGRADDPFYFVIKCKDCNANIYAENGSLEDAIAAWNRRAK